jgi:glycosyltransferase involved in cell wall biosynthesis
MTLAENPLVTVITVTYNSARYVRDAIESVLAQEYGNIEYIISDDRSTDDTWEIIQSYTDPRIRAFRNERNLGEYPNRNTAIGLATGRFLIFIDGDDIIYPHAIAFFVRMMRLFPTAALAIQKGYLNNLLYPALFAPAESLKNYFYGRHNLSVTSFASNFFRADIIKELLLKTGIISGDDEIRLRIASRYPVLYVAGSLTWFRETPGQASSAIGSGRSVAEHYRFTEAILSDPGLTGVDEDLVTDLKNFHQRRLARYAVSLLKRGRWRDFIELKRFAGMSVARLLRQYRYQPRFKDPLGEFSPVNPYRADFLKDARITLKK